MVNGSFCFSSFDGKRCRKFSLKLPILLNNFKLVIQHSYFCLVLLKGSLSRRREYSSFF